MYGNDEKAKRRRTAKMGISQARMSEARPLLISWNVMYLVGLSAPWPASREMIN